jgi:hypothetical protein
MKPNRFRALSYVIHPTPHAYLHFKFEICRIEYPCLIGKPAYCLLLAANMLVIISLRMDANSLIMILLCICVAYNTRSSIYDAAIVAVSRLQSFVGKLTAARQSHRLCITRPIHAEVCRKAERPAGNSEGSSRAMNAPMRAPYTQRPQRFARGSGQNWHFVSLACQENFKQWQEGDGPRVEAKPGGRINHTHKGLPCGLGNPRVYLP